MERLLLQNNKIPLRGEAHKRLRNKLEKKKVVNKKTIKKPNSTSKRHNAATSIQKYARGCQGRTVASKHGRVYNTAQSRCQKLAAVQKNLKRLGENKSGRLLLSNGETGSSSVVYLIRARKNPNRVVRKNNPGGLTEYINEYFMYGFFNAFVKYKVTPFVIQRLNTTNFNPSNDSFALFTQTYGNMSTLEDFLDSLKKTSEDVEKCNRVIFQILYTLSCMNTIGMRHNDLHLGNLFVVHFGSAVHSKGCYSFQMKNKAKYYQSVFGPQVRMFDLDRGIKGPAPGNRRVKQEFSKTTPQKILNEWDGHYTDTSYVPYFDTYKIMHHIMKHPRVKHFPIVREIAKYYQNKGPSNLNGLNSYYSRYYLLFNNTVNEKVRQFQNGFLPTPDDLITNIFGVYQARPRGCIHEERYKQANVYTNSS